MRHHSILLALFALGLSSAADAQVYPYPSYAYGYSESDVKVNVTPNDAEVYVDGYYAGRVDDFDGPFQRLRVEAGQHEIVIYKTGHRPLRERLYLSPRSTRKLAGRLEPLAAGERDEGVPRPAPAPPQATGQGLNPNDPNAPTGGEAERSGILAIRVQPADTELVIDGERWPASPGDQRLLVELSEGRHVVEIRKTGYRQFSTEIEVRPRQTTPLNVSLTRQ